MLVAAHRRPLCQLSHQSSAEPIRMTSRIQPELTMATRVSNNAPTFRRRRHRKVGARTTPTGSNNSGHQAGRTTRPLCRLDGVMSREADSTTGVGTWFDAFAASNVTTTISQNSGLQAQQKVHRAFRTPTIATMVGSLRESRNSGTQRNSK